jgi:hypothetical protein
LAAVRLLKATPFLSNSKLEIRAFNDVVYSLQQVFVPVMNCVV